MQTECIENKYGNSNFTIKEKYEIFDNMITCNFVKLNLPKDFILKNTFEFAYCKFRLIV